MKTLIKTSSRFYFLSLALLMLCAFLLMSHSVNASCLACNEIARQGAVDEIPFPQCCGDYPPNPSSPAVCGSAPNTTDADGDGIPDNLESFTDDFDGDGVVEGLDEHFVDIDELNVPVPLWVLLLTACFLLMCGALAIRQDKLSSQAILRNAVVLFAFLSLSNHSNLEAEQAATQSSVSIQSSFAMASGQFDIEVAIDTAINPQNYNVWLEQWNGSSYEKIDASVNSSSFGFLSDAEQPEIRLQRCLSTLENTEVNTLYTSVVPPNVSGIPLLTVPQNVNEGGGETISWTAITSADYYELEQRINGETWELVHRGFELEWQIAYPYVGNYEYRVRACETNGSQLVANCGDKSPIASVLIDTGAVPPIKPAASPTPIPLNAIEHSQSVGATEAVFEVDYLGNAVYRIPILAASGIANVTPSIELAYSSASGNGAAGYGWMIAGVSSITRCPATMHDGAAKPISWNEADRFCLDGRRLLVSNGWSYGDVGAEYRTEIDTYVVVQSVGGSQGKPDHFIVVGKDGNQRSFGATQDSKNVAFNDNGTLSTNVLYWSISRAENSFGNGIDYQYLLDGDGHRISKISYAGGQSSINFEYGAQNRSDSITHYTSGYRFSQNKRLSAITSKNNGKELRRYVLSYASQTTVAPLSRLLSVQECRELSCWPATQFSWKIGTASLSHQPSHFVQPNVFVGNRVVGGDFLRSGKSFISYGEDGTSKFLMNLKRSNVGSWVQKNYAIGGWQPSALLGDWDGNGEQDVAWYDRSTGTNIWDLFPSTDSQDFVARDSKTNAIHTLFFLENQAVVGDWNADGIDDVAMQYPYFGNTYFLVNDGDRNFTPVPDNISGDDVTHGQFTAVDINNDGKDDIIWTHCHDVSCSDEWDSGTFNDDGATGNGQILIYINQGDMNFVKHTPNINPSLMSNVSYVYTDWNGDGMTDILAYSEDTGENHWFVSKGDGDFFHYPHLINLPDPPYSRKLSIQTGDWNGDQTVDFLWTMYWKNSGSIINTGRYVNGSNMQFSFLDHVSDSITVHCKSLHVADLNGDGVDDLLYLKPRTSLATKLVSYPYISGLKKPQIIEFENGLNQKIEVTYKPIFNESTTITDSVPLADYPSSSYISDKLQVVSEVTKSLEATIAYQYGMLRRVAGRGLLGFSVREQTNQETGVTIRTVNEDRFPYINAAKEIEVRLSNGQVISRTTNNWQFNTDLSSGAYQPFIASSTKYNFSFENGQLLSKTLKSDVYDSFGNKLESIVQRRKGSNALVKRTTVVNEYPQDDFALRFGRASRSLVTHYKPNSLGLPTTITREVAFDYYGFGSMQGILRSETIEPNKSDFKVVKTYDYDDHGNKLIETMSGDNFDTRKYERIYRGDGRYLIKEKNAFGQIIRSVLKRNEYGQPMDVANLNGVISKTSYDAMGRAVQTFSTVGDSINTLYEWCVGLDAMPQCDSGAVSDGAIYRVVETLASGGWQSIYYDMLNRAVQTDRIGFDGQIIRRKTEYDLLGRVRRQSEPYFVGDSVHWTTNTYDVMNRITHILHPDNSQTTQTYNGLESTATNDASQIMTELRNVLEEVVKITDNVSGTVDYVFDPQGNLVRTQHNGTPTDPHNVITTIQHDLRGRKTQIQDPDKGQWLYQYNAIGELLTQTNANQQTINQSYDVLGRLTRRIDRRSDGTIESDTLWAFNNATDLTQQSGLGELITVYDSVTGYNRQYSHDEYGRVKDTKETLGLNGVLGSYTWSTTYDEFGRVYQAFDASGDWRGVENIYNTYGYLGEVRESRIVNNVIKSYYHVNAMSARSQVEVMLYANGVQKEMVYDDETGQIERLLAKPILSASYTQDLVLDWDTIGNLTHKINRNLTADVQGGGNLNLQETYFYDGLNRLMETRLDDVVIQTQSYNSVGNTLSKSGMGSYQYDSECVNGFGYHAVCEIIGGANNYRFEYDNNGNMVRDFMDGAIRRTIDYSAFDKPLAMTKGNHEVRFAYGADRQRYLRQDIDNTNAPATTNTLYLGSVERIEYPNGDIKWKRHINADVIVTETETTSQTRYILRDHLGSVDIILDDAGSPVQAMGFDAWGQRRSAVSFQPLSVVELLSFNSSETTRGFTDHEMIDSMGLIHMNGRIYDPQIARFMQADPSIPNALDTQDFNRYSYIRNNPLNNIDPSGFNPLYWIRDQLAKLGEGFANAFGSFFSGIASAVSSIVRAAGKLGSAIGANLRNGYPKYKGEVTFDGKKIGEFNFSSFAEVLEEMETFTDMTNTDAFTMTFDEGVSLGSLLGIEDVNGSERGGSSGGAFSKNTNLKSKVTFHDSGDVTLDFTVSAEAGQEKMRDIFVRRAGGTATVKGGCNFFGFNCKTNFKLNFDLTRFTGEGIADIHIVSRSTLASVNQRAFEDLQNTSNCTDACAIPGKGFIHINNNRLSTRQLRHELFHTIGFKHGDRSRGDFMHTQAGGPIRARHIEELRQHF